MRSEFLIEHRGKQFVLYAGLLDEAHENHELHSINTLLVQVPDAKNGNVAIVFAKVTLDSDAEPSERRTFTGLGDASPENVGRNIVPHIIRMAETRAKARALRDAVNVGVTAFEELGGDDAPDQPARAPERASSRLSARPSGPAMASAEQISQLADLIRSVWGEGGIQRFVQNHGDLDKLSDTEAEEWIDEIKATIASRERVER